MEIIVLGTGTSTGVPVPGCRCEVCTSDEPRDQRLRPSIAIRLEHEQQARYVLVDTTTDLRQQVLREQIPRLDAVLITHTHADHIFGLDDLRGFNFVLKSSIPIYATETSATELRRIFSYAFTPDPNYQGGARPNLELHHVEPFSTLDLFGVPFQLLAVEHGNMEVLALRVGSFAYVTDCSKIPEQSREALKDLDVLILDGLRNRPHNTHFSFEQAVAEIEVLQPKKAYLTHLSHELRHEEANQILSGMTSRDVQLAWDGLQIVL